jgi:hypothetical protein
MAQLDFSEMLILFLLVAAGAWLVYNWTHPDAPSPK